MYAIRITKFSYNANVGMTYVYLYAKICNQYVNILSDLIFEQINKCDITFKSLGSISYEFIMYENISSFTFRNYMEVLHKL